MEARVHKQSFIDRKGSEDFAQIPAFTVTPETRKVTTGSVGTFVHYGWPLHSFINEVLDPIKF